MNREDIINHGELVRERLAYWTDQERKLQTLCSHPLAIRQPRAQTGYSEPTTYWYACFCTDCGRRWKEER